MQFTAGKLQDGKGTGLGLSISKRLVELHGGTVGCQSEVNRGSSFFFEVPCEVRREQPLLVQNGSAHHDSGVHTELQPLTLPDLGDEPRLAFSSSATQILALQPGDRELKLPHHPLSSLTDDQDWFTVPGSRGYPSDPSFTASVSAPAWLRCSAQKSDGATAWAADAVSRRDRGCDVEDWKDAKCRVDALDALGPHITAASRMVDVDVLPSAAESIPSNSSSGNDTVDAQVKQADGVSSSRVPPTEMPSSQISDRISIHAESMQGQWIAGAEVHETDIPADASGHQTSGRSARKGPRVLLVEDHVVTARLMRMMLQRLGCCVTTAEDGLAAVAAVRAGSIGSAAVVDVASSPESTVHLSVVTSMESRPAFDLILMDGHMPRMGTLTCSHVDTQDLPRLLLKRVFSARV